MTQRWRESGEGLVDVRVIGVRQPPPPAQHRHDHNDDVKSIPLRPRRDEEKSARRIGQLGRAVLCSFESARPEPTEDTPTLTDGVDSLGDCAQSRRVVQHGGQLHCMRIERVWPAWIRPSVLGLIAQDGERRTEPPRVG